MYNCTFQMENITNFVKFCEAYGVPKTGTFQTVDLFEGRNMAQVLNCIQQLGTEVHDDVIDNLPRPLNICQVALKFSKI